MKLLCICPIGIGNYLLCYPSWAILRSELPDAELHLLALRNSITDLAGKDRLWNTVHCIDPTAQPGARKSFAFIRTLRMERYSASLSFFPSNTWQYNLLPFLAGIPRRYAFRYRFKGVSSLSFVNTRLRETDPSLHDVFQNVALAELFLEKELKDPRISFPTLFSPAEMQRAHALLPEHGKPFFAVHPGSSAEHGMDAKRWPPERFGALADRIGEALGATALILGGPEEKGLKLTVAAAMKRPHRIVAPQQLRITSAMLHGCALCLCNDSGIMHLAAATGTPVIALFGPTDERRNGPFGPGHCIIRKPMPGFPVWTAANVGSRRLPRGFDPRRSLLALSVDEAWGQCSRFLSEASLLYTKPFR